MGGAHGRYCHRMKRPEQHGGWSSRRGYFGGCGSQGRKAPFVDWGRAPVLVVLSQERGLVQMLGLALRTFTPARLDLRLQPIEVHVVNGRDVESNQLREQQASDDGQSQAATRFGASSES